jgi:prepilin-type N-terminal cleavage/methylation domain-containing protein
MFRQLSARLRPQVVARVDARDDSGFTLIEAVMAMTLFAIISTALLGVLVSGVSAQRLSRQKTIAEQSTTAELEFIRTLPYSSVGNTGGNPSGTIPLTQSISSVLGSAYPGLVGTVTTKIEWNNSQLDKVATSYRNAAFYKKVTITVTRSSDGKVMAQMVTYVADVNGGTGVADAEIDLQVLDIGSNTPLAGQDVNLTTGPTAVAAGGSMTDTTDSGGNIIFPALLANPVSGPTAYYDLKMPSPLSGYTLLKDDDVAQTPASANAHIQLAPSQIFPSTLRVYQGSNITVNLQKATNGAIYSGNATVTMSTTLRGTATNQSYPYVGSPLPINTFAGEPVIPSPSPIITGGYTASVSNGFYATSVTKATVPNAYPTDLTSSFTLTGYPTGTFTATVTWAGNPVNGATVTLNGGPVAGWGPKTATTNSSGVATFNDVPEGSGYTFTATKSGQTSSSVAATAVGGTTVNVPIAMPVGTIVATVQSASTPVPGATVTVSGGNLSGSVSGTSDSAGQVTFSNVPAGSSMTVGAVKGAQNGSTTGVSVTGGNTTNVTVDMPLGTLVVTMKWAGNVVANCSNCVTLSGGALGSPVTGSTNASGQVTFSNIPPSTGYQVDATKNGQTGTVSGLTISSGANAVTVNLPVGSVAVTVTWAGSPVASCSNCVTISGGNLAASVTGSTDASGQVTFSNIPTGTGYTVTATKSGQTGTATSVTVTNGATTPVPIAMPVGTFVVTVNQPSGTAANGASVTLSGGPMSISVPGTTNSSGQVTFSNIPAGSGYTINASRYGQSGSATSQSVTGGGTTPVTINLAAYAQGSIKVTINKSGGTTCNSTQFNWTISGGPYSYSQSGTATTTTLGVLGTFSGFPAGAGYTVTVSKTSNGSQNGTVSSVTVTNGSTTSVTVTLNTNTCP